jgi:hypothetical protein
MAINSTIVTGTNTLIFSATSDQAITTIMFCNCDTSASATLDVYAVGNGNVVSTGTQILRRLSLPATETFVMDTEKLILANGDALWAVSSGAFVTSSISSVSI